MSAVATYKEKLAAFLQAKKEAAQLRKAAVKAWDAVPADQRAGLEPPPMKRNPE
jgi:hypothetical protein